MPVYKKDSGTAKAAVPKKKPRTRGDMVAFTSSAKSAAKKKPVKLPNIRVPDIKMPDIKLPTSSQKPNTSIGPVQISQPKYLKKTILWKNGK